MTRGATNQKNESQTRIQFGILLIAEHTGTLY